MLVLTVYVYVQHILLCFALSAYFLLFYYIIQLHKSKQKNVSRRYSSIKKKQDNDTTAQLETKIQLKEMDEGEGGGEGDNGAGEVVLNNDDIDILFVEECEQEREVDKVNKVEEETEVDEVNKVEEGEEEENTGTREVASTNLPQVPDIDYLTDLTELQNQWKSTNTQSLGELWYHLLK